MGIENISLRAMREDDLVVYDRFLTDPEAAGPFEWHGFSDPHTVRRQWALNGLIDEDGGKLLVVDRAERLGFVSWRKIVLARGGAYCWQIGIVLMPEARGRGVGTQAQRLLVRYLFAHTHVERIEAGTELENLAEQRALEKIGMTREGVGRSTSYRNGKWRDGVMYSILRHEVPLED